MLFVDVREGVSGDMLLAALLGLLEDDARADAEARIANVGSTMDVEFRLVVVDDAGDKGLAIAHVPARSRTHGRSRDEAFEIVERAESELRSGRTKAHEMLARIFEAEAKAHGLPAHDVHLHEIGRLEALLNLTAIGYVHALLARGGAGDMQCSAITTGKGIVLTSHGPVDVPAPASRFMLEGWEHEPGPYVGERATPTGIAALTTLATTQAASPPTGWLKRSVGFGSRSFCGRLGRTVALLAP